MVISELSAELSPHGDDHFAGIGTFRERAFISVRRARKRHLRADKAAQFACLQRVGNFRELCAVWFDDEERLPGALVLGSLAVRRNGDQAATRRQHVP